MNEGTPDAEPNVVKEQSIPPEQRVLVEDVSLKRGTQDAILDNKRTGTPAELSPISQPGLTNRETDAEQVARQSHVQPQLHHPETSLGEPQVEGGVQEPPMNTSEAGLYNPFFGTAQPQTVTMMEVTEDQRRNLQIIAARGRDDLPETTFETILKKIFSRNALYGKPNIAVVLQMLEVLVLIGVFTLVVWYSRSDSFKGMLIPYWLDFILEAGLVYLYSRCTFVQPGFKNICVIPVICKGLGILAVTLDVFNGGKVSAYLCWCPLIPPLMAVFQATGYSFIKILPPCLAIFIGITEAIFMLRLAGSVRTSYSTILIILFYYFLVTMFFTVIGFLTSVFKFIVAIFSCFAEFNIRLFIIQFTLGCDNIISVALLMVFSNWIFSMDSVNMFQSQIDNGTFDVKSMDDYNKALNQKSSNLRIVRIIALIAFIYLVVRHISVFWATKSEIGAQQLFEMRNNLGYAPGVPSASGRGRGAQENVPRVEKPSTTQNILNLFRTNGNYYRSVEGNTTQPADPNQQPGEQPRVSHLNQEGTTLKVPSMPRSPEDRDSENLCSICMSEPPNCIILNCRHGGICKGCTMDMMKKSNLCPFCRKHIEKVCVVLKISDQQYRIVEEIKI